MGITGNFTPILDPENLPFIAPIDIINGNIDEVAFKNAQTTFNQLDMWVPKFL